MSDKSEDYYVIFALLLAFGFTCGFLFGMGLTYVTPMSYSYITWEEHNITDIIYYDDGIISGKYPVEDITKEIVTEDGETLGINMDMLSIGDVYNMHIYRDNYKGNNVAWIDACDNVVI